MKRSLVLAAAAATMPLLGMLADAAIPRPPQRLCIEETGACSATTQTKGVKWHPGHYMLVYAGDKDSYSARCNEIANEPNIRGIKVRLFWRDIETSRDVYSVQKIRNWLNACSKYGKRIVLELEPRAYNGGNDISNARENLPDYIVDNPSYGWAPFGRQGVTSKIWLQSVTDRWILLQKAVAAQLDNEEYLEAVSVGPGESSPGWHSITPPADYSDSAWRTQMQRRITAVAAAWQHTIAVQGFNWLPNNDVDRANLIAHMAENKIAQGGPDIFGDAARITDGQKAYIGTIGGIDYRGIIPLMHDVQAPELGGSCGWDGDYTPAQIFNIATNTLHATHLYWIRNICGDTEGNWSTGILPFIRNDMNAIKNTACPKSFDSCDSR